MSVLPRLRLRRFATATAAGAALAYVLGFATSMLADQGSTPPILLLVLGTAIGGALLLGSIGAAQWWELRHMLSHSGSWVVTTGLSWAAGLGVFMTVAMPLWQEGQPPWAAVLVGLVAAVCMAATVAALTGLALIRLLRREKVVR